MDTTLSSTEDRARLIGMDARVETKHTDLMKLVDGESIVIGREGQIRIAGGETLVSRQHAAIRRYQSRFFLKGMGGHSVWINGGIIPPPDEHLLLNGEQIALTHPKDSMLIFLDPNAAALPVYPLYPEMCIVVEGVKIRLTPRQLELFSYLLNRIGMVISSEELSTAIWKADSNSSGKNNLEQLVRAVRSLIAQHSTKVRIATLRGVGYRLDVDGEEKS